MSKQRADLEEALEFIQAAENDLGFRADFGRWALEVMPLMVEELQAHREQEAGSERLREALRELCALKYLKDTEGKTPEYLDRQPKAWDDAFAALSAG